MTPLSDAALAHVEKLFPRPIRGDVVMVLEERLAETSDRVRFAVLKLSCGNFVRLLAAVADANTDWRDTLMAAGFGLDPAAHERWKP